MSISHEKFLETIESEQILDYSSSPKSDLRMLSKQISQVIAQSWLPGGEKIRAALLSNDSKKIQKMLESNEHIDKALLELLQLGKATKIEVDWNDFFGKLEESKDPEYIFKFVLAYPPRPSEYNISDGDIVDWVNNNDPNIYTPTHPYIPVTW